MLAKIKNKEEKMKKTPIWILMLSVTTVCIEVLRELSSFCIRKYEINQKSKDDQTAKGDIRLIFLSVLHGNNYGSKNVKLVKAVKKQRPDAILIGGDMLTRTEKDTDCTAVSLLKELASIAPVYAANGNHEQKMKDEPEFYDDRYARYKEQLLDCGVHILENESCDVQWKGMPVTITGLEIPISCYSHFRERPLAVKEIEARIGKPDPSRYQVLLAHNPVYMEQYSRWGADLTFSGHLHGGIIRLPFIGGLITPQAQLFPRFSGDIYQTEGCYGIVSRGLGTHTVNLRYLNMAELVSVTLKKE